MQVLTQGCESTECNAVLLTARNNPATTSCTIAVRNGRYHPNLRECWGDRKTAKPRQQITVKPEYVACCGWSQPASTLAAVWVERATKGCLVTSI